MAAVIGSLRADLSASIADFASGFNKAADQVKSFSDRFTKAGRAMQDFGGSMSLYVSAPLALLGASFVKAAMGAEEMQSAFGVSFGAMADDTAAWAETTGDAMGRSTYELQAAASAFNGLFKAGGPATEQAKEMSKTFTVLAQDLSSFFDMSPEEALDRLRSGLSGEAEPLRRFNVYLTEGAVKAEAYAMGIAKAGAELTEQQKIQARASLILKGTAEAQGDVIRTSGSATNQVRAMTSQWNELSVTMGQKILPLFTPVVAALGRMVEGFAGLPGPVQNAILVIGGLAIVAGPVLVALGAIVSAIGTLAPLVAGAAAGVAAAGAGLAAAFAPVILPIVAAIAAAVLVFVLFRDTIVENAAIVRDAFQNTLGGPLAALFADVRKMVSDFGAMFAQVMRGPVGDGLRYAKGLLEDFSAIMTRVWSEVVVRVLNAFVQVFRGVVNQIGAAVRLVTAVLTGDWKGAWEAAKDIVANVVDTMLNVLDALFPGAKAAVLNMVGGIRAVFTDMLAPLFGWIGDRAQDVADRFGGAFRAAVDWARSLYNGVRGWIADKLGPLLDWARDRLRDLRRAFGALADESRAPAAIARTGGRAPAAAPAAAAAPPPAAPAAPTAPGGGGGGRGGGGAADAARDYAQALAQLKEKLDPVSAAMAAYRESLAVAARGGVDMTAATNLLAREAVDAAGGWAVLKDRLDTLPPAVAAAARAMRMEAIQADVQAIADMANPLAAAVRQYNEAVALAVEGGLKLADVESSIAARAFEAAGGLDVWRNSLDQLPPALRAAADAAVAAETGQYREDLARTGEQLRLNYDAQYAYNEEMKRLNELLREGAISQEVFAAAAADAQESYRQHLADTNPAIRAQQDAVDAVVGSLGDVMDGTKSWSDAWKDLVKELLKILVIEPILKRIKEAMNGMGQTGGAPGGGGGAGGWIQAGLQIASAVFGGARENGGPVVPGRVYMVGEAGPEPFIPKTSGTILPHGSLGDGGPVAPNITVYASDALTTAWIKSAVQQAYVSAVRDGAEAAVGIARQVIPEEMMRQNANRFV